ncbi:bacterial transcriptional activator domain-containing protein [Streptomyces sp. NBC_01221]|uniref:bacterial transcriptional activator domain-containing protein n=1 Tax=Streptomyces sp. NBC_01221 TaxID=2903782 RepID=UPI002251E868|nr:bacterial transcriptional activator domain-containing protein [Streptomyces sp. NBC_01221]MCX4788563.1 bacterial transcriptional activator domain-containing protein [Streptomyces sp. NBC_01221]
MARTTSRTSSRPRPPRRTLGDFVKAFLAFVALASLVVGVPGALAYFVGWPLPDEMPSLDMLQRQITVDTFISVLTVVVWLAWAQFTACVLVEVKAAVSGVGMPTRVPGAGASQALARQLVAALLLVMAGAASFTPGLSQLGQTLEEQSRPAVASAAQQTPGEQLQAPAREKAAERAENMKRTAGTAKEQGTKFYRIQPPEGRHHDSLWEVAERHLGDGRRYKEVYQLNKDRVQPDGSKLSQASLIRPGWIMEMPADAHGGDLVEMPDEAPKVSEEVRRQIQEYAEAGDRAQGRGAQQGDDRHEGGRSGVDTDTAQIALPAQRPAAPDTGSESGTEVATPVVGDSSFGLPEALIASPLLAAGLLAALGRRRRTALWQSAMGAVTGRGGSEPSVPTGAAADVQDALLVGADPEAVRLLDRSLRGLSAALTAESRPLPVVYAAWLADGELHLQLGRPEGRPPAPWQEGQDATFWHLEKSAAGVYGDADTASPYPGLVSLGTHDDSRLLLNLESVPGVVSLTGAAEDRAAVLASIAAELATSGWSDRMTVTLVGFGEELGALAPTRLRHLEEVEDLLEVMEAETRQRRGALGAAGHDSVLTGRTGHVQNNRWAPHLVLLAAEPTETQAARLTELASDAGRLGIGYLVGTGSADLPGAVWQLEVTPDGRLLAPLLGLELKAQMLPRAQHDAVVQLFKDAEPDHDPNPDPSHSPFLVDITERGRPAVYARLVGTYELIGIDAPDSERSVLLHEALALLLLHREGVHPQVLAASLWPRGVTEDVRDALVERLREWLGADPDGSPRLRLDPAGRLTLAASVVSDLDVLRSLHHEATQGRGARNAAVRERLLTDALGLVRGPLLVDRPEGRYGWLAHEITDAQLPLLVADVALALSEHHLEQGRPEQAVAALTVALSSSPNDERLWNELLRATHATGDTERLAVLAASLVARADEPGDVGRGLPPRTEALLDELLPTWRDADAATG